MHKQHPKKKKRERKKNPECNYNPEGGCEVCSAWDEDIHKEQLKGRHDWWSDDIIQWAVYGPSTRRNVSVVLSLRQHKWRLWVQLFGRNCPFTHCIDHLQCKNEATAIQEIWTQCQYPLMAKSSRCIEFGWNGQELPDVLNLTGHGDTNLFSLDIKVSLDSDLHTAWGYQGICLLFSS